MIRSQIIQITAPQILQTGMRVFSSLEGENPGGSIKDHMVFGELQDLMANRQIKKGDVITEVSAGSTALSLAHYTKELGLKCHLFVPPTLSPEKCQRLIELGAFLHVHEAATIYEKEKEFVLKSEAISFNQLWDSTKIRHYQSLAKQFHNHIGQPDLVIGATGTGHSLKGVAAVFKNSQVIAAMPAGTLKIPGVRNLKLERYGPLDPCSERDFHAVMEVIESDLFPGHKTASDHGIAKIGDSFRLVLSAVLQLPKNADINSVLALGADNALIKY